VPDKPTVNDIARHAGVSLATVDRVLNDRPGVRSATIERVNRAIDEIGYVRDTAAANLARRRVYRLVFMLPDVQGEFFGALQNQIVAQAKLLANERTRLDTISTTAFEPLDIVNALDKLQPQEVDGVAILAPETPQVRDAVVRARSRGIAVVTIVSDLPSSTRDHFVGIDNINAGKTAARLLGSIMSPEPKNILVVTGSRYARDHLERRNGFDELMTDEFPHLRVLPSIVAHDQSGLVYNGLQTAWQSHDDIGGIYSSAGGNSGLIQFLETLPCRPVVIAHELTPINRQALIERHLDAVISQDTGHIVRSAVRLLRATADSAPFNATQERIGIDIYLRENLPLPEFD
jgi:LacI family transcriptional regulator